MMSAIRKSLKKLYQAILRVAWLLGGQKEHSSSGLALPSGASVSEEAVLIFPDNISIGDGVMILPCARLICARMPPYLEGSGYIVIGKKSIVRESALIQTYGGRIEIGEESTINPFCVLQGNGGIKIGNSVLIAAGVKMFSANHVFESREKSIREQGDTKKGIVIGDDVWIGAGCTILDGVKVGNGAVIAAGSVVNRDVGEYSIFAGVPAKFVKMRHE